MHNQNAFIFLEYKTISEKKVGLITGGTSGLGLAVARKLVKAGYHIFIGNLTLLFSALFYLVFNIVKSYRICVFNN